MRQYIEACALMCANTVMIDKCFNKKKKLKCKLRLYIEACALLCANTVMIDKCFNKKKKLKCQLRLYIEACALMCANTVMIEKCFIADQQHGSRLRDGCHSASGVRSRHSPRDTHGVSRPRAQL